jgi:hypothetical protein
VNVHNNKNPNRNTRFRLYTAAEIIQRPEPRYLIRGVLHTGSAAMVFGYYGEVKTTLAQDLAFSIGAGLPWHGHDVRRGTVVYIDDMQDGGSSPARETRLSTVKITCTKNRRGPRHAEVRLALKPVVIDGMYDEYGDPVTACVLVDVDPNDARAGMWPDTGLFGEKERTLLDVIDRLMTTHNTAAIRSSLWEAGSGLKERTFHRSRDTRSRRFGCWISKYPSSAALPL